MDPEEKPKELVKIPSKTDEELKQFVLDFLGNRIFCMQHVAQQDLHLLGSIFMYAGLGGLATVDRESVGTIYEYLDEAGQRGVNGYPTFISLKMLNKEDWARALKVIVEEQARLENVKV